jgi:hypothetical protein
MMDAGEGNVKERIWMSTVAYSVLKDVLNYDECGWSKPYHHTLYS